MDKKLINEDIANMKYLLGYKAGRVISEQEQPEIDEYFHGDMKDLNRSKHPERLVRHSDTGKLVGTHKHGEGFHPNPHGEELGFEHHPMDIPHGTKFGGTEIGDFDYEDEFEFDEDINEQYDDQNGMNWVQNTTMDRQNPIDDDNDVEGSMKSILKKHHLLNDVESNGNNSIMVKQKSSKIVQRLISILHLLDNLIFLAIVDCESADFSDVDICDMPKLTFINLSGTEHNLGEQGYECLDGEDNNIFYHIP